MAFKQEYDAVSDVPTRLADQPRWLVQGEDVRSGVFATRASNDPAILPLETIAADVVLVSMSATIAEKIRTEFGGRLIVEQDRFLNPP
jgi:hypothetical protein